MLEVSIETLPFFHCAFVANVEEKNFTRRKYCVSNIRYVDITVYTVIFTSSFGVLHCGHVRNSCLHRKLNGAGVTCEGRSPAVVPTV